MVSKKPRAKVLVRGIGCFSVSVTFSPPSSLPRRAWVSPPSRQRKLGQPLAHGNYFYSFAGSSLRVPHDPELRELMENLGILGNEDGLGIQEAEEGQRMGVAEDGAQDQAREDDSLDVSGFLVDYYPRRDSWLAEPFRARQEGHLYFEDWYEFLSSLSSFEEDGDSPDEDEDEYMTALSEFEDIGKDEDEGDEDSANQGGCLTAHYGPHEYMSA